MRMAVDIPDGLREMLRDFTISVLRRRPSDLYDYAVEYFTLARHQQRRRDDSDTSGNENSDADDESDDDDRMTPPISANHFRRRQSISAERYDPEAEDSEDSDDKGESEKAVVYPKSDDQRGRLNESVRDILIFRSLDQNQIGNVIDAMYERKTEAGETVIKQGDDGDNFYVIESGTYDVFIKNDDKDSKDTHIHRFENHGNFGELALMYNQPRSATVIASSPGVLWVMDRRCFRRIVLRSAFRKRRMYEDMLSELPMLQSLEPYERMNVADALLSRDFADGERVIRQDDPADGMYFVESGEVCVTLTKENGEEVTVGGEDRKPVKFFGELALVENQPRSANVYAMGPVKLAFLERASFERLLGPCVDIMKRNFDAYERFA